MAAIAPCLPVDRSPQRSAIRVLLADDSRVVRAIFKGWLEDEPGVELVGACPDGEEAIRKTRECRPDVVILDIEMPGMDGLTALPMILKAHPGVRVLVASSLTRRGASISIEALTRGAADYVHKPDADPGGASAAFRDDLMRRIKALGQARTPGPRVQAVSGAPAGSAGTTARTRPHDLGSGACVRRVLRRPVEVLAIASSTGGPEALMAVFRDIGPDLAGVPVVVVQHMPATFTALLAEHIGRAAGRPATEAVDGEPLVAGTIRVAPGGRHLKIVRAGGRAVLRLSDDPPVNFCRPAADVLFKSVADAFGGGTLAIVLTGMGADGARGAAEIAAAGGTVIAQDEASSVVWGMPRAVVQIGAANSVLSLSDIGREVSGLIRRRPS